MSRKASIILTAVLGAIIALWLWTAIVPKNALSIGGSTSVDPIMQRLTNIYKKDNKGDSFVYSSSGSRGGVTNVESGTYKMGFISKEVSGDLKDKVIDNKDNKYDKKNFNISEYLTNKDVKNENKMHQIKIADDAILLTYIAPKWFEDKYSSEFNIEIDEKDGTTVSKKWKEIMQYIYSGDANWEGVAQMIDGKLNKAEAISFSKNSKEKIVPFARETGSGTRNTFDKKFGLAGDKDRPSSKATEFNSNGMMFTSLKMNTFGYISMNYLEEARKNEQIKLALVGGLDPNKEEFENEVESYKFLRPFIGLFNSNMENKFLEKIAKFLEWIREENAQVKKQYEHEGLIFKFKLDGMDLKI